MATEHFNAISSGQGTKHILLNNSIFRPHSHFSGVVPVISIMSSEADGSSSESRAAFGCHVLLVLLPEGTVPPCFPDTFEDYN